MNPNEIECPNCGEWLELGDYQIEIHCLGCQEQWIISHDGEFVDGLWHDRTILIKHDLSPDDAPSTLTREN